ncbi:hypothetical protein OIO07_03460 [Bacillus paralicheniformis]|uniref:hypothetical protein n=1 Tax=Bacillus paralicheniformis TaxID=1648923 RepID=UPI00067FA15C|nr:hypothetical protein [Bacillus paralicheniformis]KND05349.1 hypothetical protein ACJ43_22215 [Bacillus paralicheniformis]MCV9367326.1 hypothetical protein [Bacillus paralicheniformis]MEC1870365.1 hypothetical protein [Bacillus paralicheniformis]MED1148936.1 hypothetical protein [Bacillus paralicheniformis]WIG09994.1 hypothetical protein QN340_23285 [Bacillus paralicheniformis]
MDAKPAAICAACNRVLNEGRSATYDSLFDRYFCGNACWSDWYAENEAEYERKWTEEVDL